MHTTPYQIHIFTRRESKFRILLQPYLYNSFFINSFIHTFPNESDKEMKVLIGVRGFKSTQPATSLVIFLPLEPCMQTLKISLQYACSSSPILPMHHDSPEAIPRWINHVQFYKLQFYSCFELLYLVDPFWMSLSPEVQSIVFSSLSSTGPPETPKRSSRDQTLGTVQTRPLSRMA